MCRTALARSSSSRQQWMPGVITSRAVARRASKLSCANPLQTWLQRAACGDLTVVIERYTNDLKHARTIHIGPLREFDSALRPKRVSHDATQRAPLAHKASVQSLFARACGWRNAAGARVSRSSPVMPRETGASSNYLRPEIRALLEAL